MPQPARFVDEKLTLTEFLDEVLVVCPRCGACAPVRPEPGGDGAMFAPRRLVCVSCGLTRRIKAKTVTLGARGTPRDPWFGEPLWLRASWGRKTLWAYNARHLAYLEAFVRAGLRAHSRTNPRCSNCSLISRLPAWMKEAGNRGRILAMIAKLRATLG
ncbi:MAG: hypothetical protein WC538_14120 [Thermoanaerobaculia bacterium]|jgi:hypothetical protein